MLTKKLEVIKGDITTLEVEAIVNAANTTLLGGGGVDGAIHRVAGPGLLEECEKLNGCEVGCAKITSGYNLKAQYIIHTVGPVWKGGHRDEHSQLASCYNSSLKLAKQNRIKTIAFPCISTGVYGFPQEQAAAISVNETKKFLLRNDIPEKVIFVTFSLESYDIYMKLLDQ
jgi:O-acetyl-ADP-ribose deacetylase